MTRFLMLPMLVLALLTAACGDDDNPVQAGGDPPGDEPIGTDPEPTTDLTITHTHSAAGVSTTYRISCLDDAATVTGDDVEIDDDAACEALTDPDVRQRLTLGAPSDRICTEIYGGEDTAAITGTIDGDPVDTTVDRANGCGIDEWDNLLAAILPTAIGVQP